MSLLSDAEAITGPGSVRAGTTADAVDGVVPKAVVEPKTAEDVGAVLAWASRDHLSVTPRGSGTKLGWGTTPDKIDLVLSTARLNRVLAHRHGDLTVTVEAGAKFGEVNAELSRHRQWIPLDPPSGDRATIGGIVATNESGPRRHRYGAPRDLIIGVSMARTDGRIAKGGGIVVKNVAGYDLPRLLAGSFGSLAVIVSANFKLYPLTAASCTLVVDANGPDDIGRIVMSLLASTLTPTAVEVSAPPLQLFVRFESIEASVEQQSAIATKLIQESGARVRIVQSAEENELWTRHNDRVRHKPGAIIKATLLPSELASVLSLLHRLVGNTDHAVAGQAGVGVLLVRVNGNLQEEQRLVSGLREILPPGRGSAVLVQASAELKKAVGVWGPVGDTVKLLREVKRQFDPVGILNANRSYGGI